MMEEFVSVALDAFTNANGDIDKFELYLRRNVMSMQVQAPTTSNTLPSTEQLDMTPEMAEELAQLDLDNMSDDDIIEYARKFGLSI
jgi:hypothetical protein